MCVPELDPDPDQVLSHLLLIHIRLYFEKILNLPFPCYNTYQQFSSEHFEYVMDVRQFSENVLY